MLCSFAGLPAAETTTKAVETTVVTTTKATKAVETTVATTTKATKAVETTVATTTKASTTIAHGILFWWDALVCVV